MAAQTCERKKCPEIKGLKPSLKSGRGIASQSGNSPYDTIKHLHRTIGNHEVQRLYKSGVLQAKLTIGKPNDINEREADRAADQAIMMKGLSENAPQISNDLSMRLALSSGGGQPLPGTDRSFMEKRFMADFSGVRIHTDSNAAQLNNELTAQAFTYGRDIYFGSGKYSPDTSAGKKLLAHELTHTLQQRPVAPTSPVFPVSAGPGAIQMDGTKEPAGSGLSILYEDEQTILNTASALRASGKMRKGAILFDKKGGIQAKGLSDNSFYAGPFNSDMGNFIYVYSFKGEGKGAKDVERHSVLYGWEKVSEDVEDVIAFIESQEEAAKKPAPDIKKNLAKTEKELSDELLKISEDLLNNFNFEINVLQENLRIADKVLSLQDIPKDSFVELFSEHLVAESLESIPFEPLGKGLKALWLAYSDNKKADEAREALEHRNRARLFVATSSQELLNYQEQFAWFKDRMDAIAKSHNKQLMAEILSGLKEPTPLKNLIREGEVYRQSLHQAFIIKNGSMKEARIDGDSDISKALDKQAEAWGRTDWLPHVLEGEEPFLHAITAATHTGSRDVVLFRFCGLKKVLLENLFTSLKDAGGGFHAGSLYLWFLSEAKAKKEKRPPPAEAIINWVAVCKY